MDDADREIRLAVCLSSFQRLSGNGVDWTDEEGVTLMRIVLSESRPHSFCKKNKICGVLYLMREAHEGVSA